MVDEMIRPTVQRSAVEQQLSRFQELQQYGRDACHTAFERGSVFGAIKDCQSVFQDFDIRIVNSAID